MEKQASTNTRKRIMIRANPAQTAMLKKAFMDFNPLSAEQLNALSEQTNLPAKWIHNWFARQRVKVNGTKGKALSALDTNTLSTDEIMRIKQEAADNPDSLAASSPVTGSASDCIAFSVSSSSVALDIAAPPPPSAPARKRRTRAKPAPPQTQIQDGPDTSPTRVLRSSTRKEVPAANKPRAAPTRRVKTELIETSVDLHSATAPAPPRKAGAAPLLPSIAPPKRSPMTAARGAPTRGRTARSGLGMQAQTMYTHIPSGADVVRNDTHAASAPAHATESGAPPPPPAKTKNARKTPHAGARLQGPVFYSQFQNNGPEHFSASSSLENVPPAIQAGHSGAYAEARRNVGFPEGGAVPALYMPQAVMSSAHAQAQMAAAFNVAAPVYHEVRPLAPAFDWETHAPSESRLGAQYTASPERGMQQLQNQNYVYADEYVFPQHWNGPSAYYDKHIAQQSAASQTIPTIALPLGAHDDVLDPSVAPLKHLTDILHEFRDENGTYLRLLMLEEHEKLLKCLLNKDLMPFEAAMALSLLSKLGLQWHY